MTLKRGDASLEDIRVEARGLEWQYKQCFLYGIAEHEGRAGI